jgi:hypothetical protein
MTFLSVSFKILVLLTLASCFTKVTAQDHFFDFYIADYPQSLRAFQFSRADKYFLVCTHHQSESTPERFIPSHYKGKVYEVSSAKLVNTFSSKDALRWLPGTDDVLVTSSKMICSLSVKGDTLQTVDLSNHIKGTYNGVKTVSLSADATMIAVRSEKDSLYLVDMSTGKVLNKLNTRVTGFQYPEITGNNQYLAAQTGPSWAWELWNIEHATKVDSFRLHDRFWLKPKQYFIENAGQLVYLDDMSSRKMWARTDRDVLDPAARYLARTYAYRFIEISDLGSGNVIQYIPLNAAESWKVLLNGRTLVASDILGENARLRFFNVEFGEEIFTIDNTDLNGYIDFHPEKSLFLATGKNEMLLFQCGETSVQRVFALKFDHLYYARFSRSGSYVIALLKNRIELFSAHDGSAVMHIAL